MAEGLGQPRGVEMTISRTLLGLPHPTVPLCTDDSQRFVRDVEQYLRRLQDRDRSIALQFTQRNMLSGVGLDKLDLWINVIANTAKTYVSERDWRGKYLTIYGSFYDGAEAASLPDQWTDGDDSFAGTFGAPFDADANESDVSLLTLNTDFDLYLEEDTGFLYVIVENYATPYQVRIFILSSERKITSDITIS